MKMRAIKTRLIRTARAVKPVTVTAKKIVFPVFRKKDHELIMIVESESAAQALVLKAKAAKKASLYIGAPRTA